MKMYEHVHDILQPVESTHIKIGRSFLVWKVVTNVTGCVIMKTARGRSWTWTPWTPKRRISLGSGALVR